MIALIRGEDEDRIALIDAIVRQPREEFAESLVVSGQLSDVACFARAERHTVHVVIMSIGDVYESDRDARLLHFGNHTKRLTGRRIKPRKADQARVRVHNDIAVQVREAARESNSKSDVLGTEQSIEPAVAARFVGQQVRYAVVGRRTDRTVFGAVHRDSLKVRNLLIEAFHYLRRG